MNANLPTPLPLIPPEHPFHQMRTETPEVAWCARTCRALGRHGARAAAGSALMVAVATAQPPRPALWGTLSPGTFGVGFRVLLRYDRARPPVPSDSGVVPPGAAGRQMPVSLWYPARPASGARHMSVTDYIARNAQALDFRPLDARRRSESVAAFVAERTGGTATAADMRALLEAKLAAVSDAPAAAGRFPLVVFIHARPVEASIMAEYLASHGFVVAGVPSKGTSEPAYRLNAANLETMVTDASYVIAAVRTLPFTHPTRVGAVGMSNGSNAAVGLAMRDAEIAAIVSLDGTIGEGPAGYLTSTTPYYGVANFTAPLLHLYAPENPFLDLVWIRSWRYADRTLVRLPGMRHGDFLAYGAFTRLAAMSSGAAAPGAAAGFEEICRRTLRFLATHLAMDSTTRAATVDASGAGQESTGENEHLPALDRPPPERELNAMIGRSGIADVIELLRQRMRYDPQPLPQTTFLALSSSLTAAGRRDAALPLARLFAEIYPASARAHLALATALAAAGDSAAARTEYGRVRELVPADTLDPYTRRRVEAAATTGLGPPHY